MKKTDRLYTDYRGMHSYDFTADSIQWDHTWRMEISPYPPEPSYNFIVEDDGEIIKILEVWEGYFYDLFYYAEKADLFLDCDFGQLWYGFCWVCESDDWLMERKDLVDFLDILKATPIYEVSAEALAADDKSMPDVQLTQELRDHLVRFITEVMEADHLLYIHPD